MDEERSPQEKKLKRRRSLQKWKSFPHRANSYKGRSRSKRWSKDSDADILQLNGDSLPKLAEEEEAVGVITMEDVIEELLQVRKSYLLLLSINSHNFFCLFYFQLIYHLFL